MGMKITTKKSLYQNMIKHLLNVFYIEYLGIHHGDILKGSISLLKSYTYYITVMNILIILIYVRN